MATTTPPLPSQRPEETDNPGQEEFDKLIRHSFTPQEEKDMEERAKEDSGSEDREEKKVSQELEQLQQGTASGTDSAKSLYRRGGSEKRGFASRLNGSYSLRKYLIIGGFSAALVAIIVLIFGFLNVFKLDGLMSSIEQRAFLRQNATLDTRSSKWINSYVEARLLDMGDNPNLSNPDFKKDENLLFRANRVDTNSPFFDWYRTLIHFRKAHPELNSPDADVTFDEQSGRFIMHRPGVRVECNFKTAEVSIQEDQAVAA